MTVSCFMNQVIDYHANWAELFVTQGQRFHFCSIAENSECCAVVLSLFSNLCLHICSVHMNLGNGYKDNPILSFRIKVNHG